MVELMSIVRRQRNYCMRTSVGENFWNSWPDPKRIETLSIQIKLWLFINNFTITISYTSSIVTDVSETKMLVAESNCYAQIIPSLSSQPLTDSTWTKLLNHEPSALCSLHYISSVIEWVLKVSPSSSTEGTWVKCDSAPLSWVKSVYWDMWNREAIGQWILWLVSWSFALYHTVFCNNKWYLTQITSLINITWYIPTAVWSTLSPRSTNTNTIKWQSQSKVKVLSVKWFHRKCYHNISR